MYKPVIYTPELIREDPASAIIVALDCDFDTARDYARKLKGHARWLKVGMTLYYQCGPKIIDALKEAGYQVFLDLKMHDIPHQIYGASRACAELGVDMLTFHGLGSREMLEAAATGIAEANHEVISLAITVLTSHSAESLREVGVADKIPQEVNRLAKLALSSGLSGVVASPHEARELRELLGPEAAIVTPGIRPANTSSQDQTRIATPVFARDAGVSHMVIGRPITQALDPVRAFEDICESLRSK